MLTGLVTSLIGIGTYRSQPAQACVCDVESVVSKLSVEVGREIWVAPELRRHHVLLRRNGHTATVALQSIAASLHASLSTSATGLILSRPSKEVEALRAMECRERASNLKTRITENAKLRARLLNGRPVSSAVSSAVLARDAQWKALLAGSRKQLDEDAGRILMPCEAILEGLCLRIGPEALSAESAERPKVFEDRQVYGAVAAPSCDDLVADYNNSVAELRKSKPALDTQVAISNTSFGGENWFRSWAGPWQPAKHFRLRVSPNQDHMSISLELYDDRGNNVDSAELDGLPVANSKDAYFQATKDHGRLISLDSEGAQACHFFRCDPHKLPAWVRDPVKVEPLNLFVLPALNAITDEDGNACVAVNVSDDLWYYGSFCQKDRELDVDAFRNLMSRWGHYEHSSHGDFATWSPKYFMEAEAEDADRNALSKYAGLLASLGRGEGIARCRLIHDASLDTGTLARQFATLSTGTWEDNWTLTNQMSRLLGAISAEDWDELLAGRKKSISQLNLGEAIEALFSEDAMRTECDEQLPDIFRHPEELLNGQSIGDLVVEAHAATVPMFQVWNASQAGQHPDGWGELPAVVQLGRVRYKGGSSPGLVTSRSDFDSAMSQFRFRVTEAVQTTAFIRLTATCYLSCRLPRKIENPSAEESYADLPQTLRDEMWRVAGLLAQRNFERRLAGTSLQDTGDAAGGVSKPIP